MRARAPQAVVLALCAVVSGCGTDAESSTRERDVPPPTAGSGPAASPTVAAPAFTSSPTSSATSSPAWSPAPSPVRPLGRAGKWRITTYYTAVESYHGGRRKAVRGCPELRCDDGDTPLGSYPEDFIEIIQTEGSGRITSGPHRGRYLNWSHSVGFWLDDTTRDSAGRPLRAWRSAAADRDVLARGQRFVVTDCGRDGAGRPVEDEVCERFRRASWTVTDLFRPGYGGEHHADVYIGEETGPGFARSAPWYTTLRDATIHPA
ncbi:hypothetical protein ABZ801_32610 [Actinomadura sp. NPDC047616]|uniref:hypothetical protein n=1 Tax=Actinomadura sp. NPDC047616 TaxID=3155914 RepID=UPI00340542EE